jgi:hypothetical protein
MIYKDAVNDRLNVNPGMEALATFLIRKVDGLLRYTMKLCCRWRGWWQNNACSPTDGLKSI